MIRLSRHSGIQGIKGIGLGSVGCAGQLVYAQLQALAMNAGFPSNLAPLMSQIALRESGGCPTAHNPGPGEDSYGLWQINVQGNPSLMGALGITDVNQLYDPATNAQAAAWLYGGDPNNINIAWASTVGAASANLTAINSNTNIVIPIAGNTVVNPGTVVAGIDLSQVNWSMVAIGIFAVILLSDI